MLEDELDELLDEELDEVDELLLAAELELDERELVAGLSPPHEISGNTSKDTAPARKVRIKGCLPILRSCI